jgi:hypothetical protein
MIGTILGVLTGIGLVISGWNGELTYGMAVGVLVLGLLGLIFPMTVGMWLTGAGFGAIVAIISSAIRTEWTSALSAALIAVACFAATWGIAALRGGPDAAPIWMRGRGY